MNKFNVKDLLLYKLKIEYDKKCQIIKNMLVHIENIHESFLLGNSERTKYIKILNETVSKLKNLYHTKLSELNENKYSDCINLQKNLNTDICVFTNIHMLRNLDMVNLMHVLDKYKMLSIDDYSNIDDLYIPLYNEIDLDIQKIMIHVGISKISDIIKILYPYTDILVKQSIEKINNSKNIFDILDNYFVSLSVLVCDTRYPDTLTISAKENTSDKYDILLDNYYTIKLNLDDLYPCYYLEITGYFKLDCLNIIIRTSDICDSYINNKYKEVENRNNIKIPKSFLDTYMSHINIGDILESDMNKFIKKYNHTYMLFEKYSKNNNFKFIFTDFINADLKTKFKMINVILMGENHNNAGLLFSFIKDVKIGSTIISEIFYKNLNFNSQIKVYKANTSIKSEIEKINNINADGIDIKKQIILNNSIPIKIKKLALEKLEEMKSGNTEYYKQLLYVKTIADFPWIDENYHDIFSEHTCDIKSWKNIMENTNNILNKQVYGHKECKNTIIELLGKWFSNPKSIGKAIGLCGSPGVGKTLIAKGLGVALGIPFTQINLGGMDDGSVLSGHSITYSGAVPGLIVKKMVEAGKPRCIMFFDELDKTSFHHGRNEIQDILIHVIDPNSNSEHNDKFFQDVQFPINKVLFIFSFNDKSKIDKILLDRMEIIDVKNYSIEEKHTIIKDYMLQKLLDDIGLSDFKINISDADTTYLIENFTNESGVRNIGRKFESILLKLNKDRIYGVGAFENNPETKSITITKDMIDTYLSKPSININHIHESNEVGVVNGLYATTGGSGGIVPIIVYKNNMGNNNKFSIRLTGKQGKVMKESIRFSYTVATRFLNDTVCENFYNSHPSGIHVHTPDGSTDKDGPSAGCGFTLGFISKILNKKVKNCVAMTGEINMNGNITAIGGLDCKLVGAKRAGIRLVFVPKENESDILKIKQTNKKLFDDNFRYQIVTNISQICDMALIEESMIEDSSDITYKKVFDYTKYASF